MAQEIVQQLPQRWIRRHRARMVIPSSPHTDSLILTLLAILPSVAIFTVILEHTILTEADPVVGGDGEVDAAITQEVFISRPISPHLPCFTVRPCVILFRFARVNFISLILQAVSVQSERVLKDSS